MIAAVRAIAGCTLLEAVRSRLHWVMLLIAASALGLAGLLQEVALTETRETQALLLGAGLRLACVAVVASFVVTSMVREAQDGSLQMLLALPIPRGAWLAGRVAGFAAFALVAAVAAGLLCLPFAAPGGALRWACALLLELWIVAAFAAFATVTLRHAVPALALVAAFYLLARSAPALSALGREHDAGAARLLGTTLDWLVLLLPRLDRFAPAEWLAYSAGPAAADTAAGAGALAAVDSGDLAGLALQAAIYITLLLAAALVDLHRRET